VTPSGSEYLHGTDPVEQRRLSTMNRLLNTRSLERLALRGGERILDLGSGLAQLTRGMGRAAGARGKVIGVERSDEQLAEAHRQAAAAGEERLVELRHGGAPDLPLADDEWGTFDVVHTRFLLEHVDEPAAVVQAMVRAARPGGRIVLEDDDHDVLRLWPEVPEAEPLWRAYMKTFSAAGRDPFIGRRLVALLHGAGARPARNHWNFFGGCAGNPDFGAMCDNFTGVLTGARQAVVTLGGLDEARFDAGVAALAAWGKRPDAALWYCTFWAEGIKPLAGRSG
jgi:SAM-dependent methyltransferase